MFDRIFLFKTQKHGKVEATSHRLISQVRQALQVPPLPLTSVIKCSSTFPALTGSMEHNIYLFFYPVQLEVCLHVRMSQTPNLYVINKTRKTQSALWQFPCEHNTSLVSMDYLLSRAPALRPTTVLNIDHRSRADGIVIKAKARIDALKCKLT